MLPSITASLSLNITLEAMNTNREANSFEGLFQNKAGC